MEKFLHLYILNGGTADEAVFPTSISGYEDCEPLLIDSFDYNAKRMGDAPSITATIMYPICLDNIWSTNVYVEFKGEKYFLKQIPTSSKSNTDARFKHEVTFVSERQALNDVYLFDVVGNKEETGVEDIGYVSNSTRFEFNGTVWDLAERINQSLRNSNIDYAIEIPEDKPSAIGEIETNESKSISFQDTYVGNALQEIYNTFEIPYYFEDKTIKLGHKAKETLTEVFEYGSENALLSIAKNNTNYKVVNRITGTGSSENIPYYYPNPTPMGFVNFFSRNQEQGTLPTNVDNYVTIVDNEKFNAKFRLSTRLYYIDKIFNYPTITEQFVQVGSEQDGFMWGESVKDVNGNYHKWYNFYQIRYGAVSMPTIEIKGSVTTEHLITVIVSPVVASDIRSNLAEFNNDIEKCLKVKLWSEIDVENQKQDIQIFSKNVRVIDANGEIIHEGRSTHITAGTYYLSLEFLTIHTSNWLDFIFENATQQITINQWYSTKGWFDENNNNTELQTYGLEYSGKVVNGTELYAKQDETKGSKIPQCSNLMPSIYRESNGSERFYNAVNYGNKNLILNSGEKFENKNYLLARYNLEHADIKEGERVTISFNGEFGNGYATFRLFGGDSSAPIVTGITTHNFNKNTGRFEYSFNWKEYGDNKQLLIYQADENRNNISSGSSVNPNRTESKIWDIKLEYGNTATKYIPAIGESNAYDSYLSPISEEDEYYEFANTYNGYNPKEHTINFEDIKPTIKEMEYNGLRIDMFEEFAYDLNDNNDKEQINESTLDFKHPYFFGKLRPLGFNLFDRALDKGFMAINMTSGNVSGAKFEIEVGGESRVNLVQVDKDGNLLRDDEGDVVIGSEAQDKQNNTTNNYVWVALKKDAESFSQENKDWVYPDYKNKIVPKAKEDTFVITNILLPNEYIIAAEKRLDEELLAYLFQNNNEKFTFSIKFSRIYLAEHPSVYENLSENSTVNVKYNGFTYAFYVSSYAYKMRANEPLPEITVELTDTLTISQSALQNALNEVKQSVISIGQANVLKTGNKYFTRKDVDDTTQGKLTFMRGAEFGEYIEGNKGASVRERDNGEWDAEFDNVKVRGKIQGALKVDGSIEVGTYAEYEDGTGNGFGVHGSDETGWNTSTDDLKVRRNAHFNKGLTVGNYINGLADGTGATISGNNEDGWTIEADYLNIRRKARFNSVEIQHTQHVGGGQVLSAAGALIDLVILHEEDNGNVFYRCYFKKQDSEGNAIFNRWMIGDQARCETFNLLSTGNENGNHYYWRLVTGTSNKVEGTTTNIEPDVNAWVTDGEDTIFIHEYHWVDLCDTEKDVNSDIPKKGDDIFLLGHRSDTNKERQSAIYEVAGDDSGVPYYRQYVGINSFSLDRCLEQQFMPNDNIFKGKVVVTGDGWKGLQNEDGEDLGDTLEAVKEIGGDLSYSATNMLRNTGFYGEGKSVELEDTTIMNVDTDMVSPSLEYWAAVNAEVRESTTSPSGYEVVFSAANGYLQQDANPAFVGESYIISFLGTSGQIYTISYGGATETVTAEAQRTKVKIKAKTTDNTFKISSASADSVVSGIVLERGTVASNNWMRSVQDVSPEIYRLQNLQYLANAIRNGSTTVKGGLILSNIIQLGNFVNGILKQVTSGVSGIFNNPADVALWSGGTFEHADKTVAKLLNNPFYNPTEEELAGMAKFVVTHGGAAILNEAIVRGSVYANNGYFRGEVNATSGTFENGTFKNVIVNGSYNRLVQYINRDNFDDFFKYAEGYTGAYYPLLLKWGDIIYLDSTHDVSAWTLLLPYSLPQFDKESGKISYINGLGYKIMGNNMRVPMDIDDLRSLIGRRIVIHGIGTEAMRISCKVYRDDTPSLDTSSNEEMLEPTTGQWHIDEQTTVPIHSGGMVILECIIADRVFERSDHEKITVETIGWSIKSVSAARTLQDGSVATFNIFYQNSRYYNFDVLLDWDWNLFVASDYNTDKLIEIREEAGETFVFINTDGDTPIEVFYDSEGTMPVKPSDKIIQGFTYYA